MEIKYNKILEAILKGINIALDDFEDTPVDTQKTKAIKDVNVFKNAILEIYRKLDLDVNLLTLEDLEIILTFYEVTNEKYLVKPDVVVPSWPLKELIQKCTELNPYANLNWVDISKIDDLSFVFVRSEFKGDISKWDVSGVKNMCGMFESAEFNGDISKWDVSQVKDMSAMFRSNKHFNQPIEDWDVSSVENMSDMFNWSIFDLPLNNWNISSVKNMTRMFLASLYNLPLDKWDVSGVEEMNSMFDGAYKFRLDIRNWQISKKCHTNNMWKMSIQYDSNKPPKTRVHIRRSWRRRY